jgi:hypothetical protein
MSTFASDGSQTYPLRDQQARHRLLVVRQNTDTAERAG